ncbi:MAG: 2-isopropylmalate synthase [Spirochaetales bacterium]|nr:2-isopropylmalate synthase [Spirochaetales bacterium]
MNKRIIIFDTTLRDGEQVPGAKLDCRQKLIIARQLVRLGVDVIEAGFPASSPGDREAVTRIAKEIKGPIITGLARAVKSDIDALWQAVRHAKRPRIHIVLGASDIHVHEKLNINRDQCLKMGVEAVRYAKSLTYDVEYSTEDASRSDFDYLCRVIETVIKAGATVINIPDTVGYAIPDEFGRLIRRIRKRVPAAAKVGLSVHCHNDLGLATINTLTAVKNGVDQVEVTVNGIGERAGNAALEEVAAILNTRTDYYKSCTNINLREITPTSRLVSRLMNIPVQPNKAIVGGNAFCHSSGIHQDGILKSRANYEIIAPEAVGVQRHSFVLTARSGKHAVRHRLQELGFELPEQQFRDLHRRFLQLADERKQVSDDDLLMLVNS